jgi:DUF2971 family protein
VTPVTARAVALRLQFLLNQNVLGVSPTVLKDDPMPVTEAENEKYRAFVSAKATEIGLFDFKLDDIVWHYTDGPGFLGIIQSCSLHATQVASLNDSAETKFATDLFKTAIQKLAEEKKDDETSRNFLQKVLEFVKEDPIAPTHGTSKFFVTCFSGEEDDPIQWDRYGKRNGYAIGFSARGLWRDPTSMLYRVVYDRALQQKVARELAEATLSFFLEGLTGERLNDPAKWGEEFFAAWDEWVYRLAPLAKDAKWKAENEFRLVHELKIWEFAQVQFKQKETMLARYLALTTPIWVKRRNPLLPIAKVMIGPGNHPSFTRVSVNLLLEQMGYPATIPVEVTKTTLQRP